jgi:hypothetical protein
MDKANQIIGSEMSKETVNFLKIQRALIEFAQQVGAERIGVEVHDKDSSANIVYGDKTDTIITTDNISYASQTTVTDRKGVIACRLRTGLHPRL